MSEVKFFKRDFMYDEYNDSYMVTARRCGSWAEAEVTVGQGHWSVGVNVDCAGELDDALKDLDKMEKFGMAVIAAAAHARQAIIDKRTQQAELKFD